MSGRRPTVVIPTSGDVEPHSTSARARRSAHLTPLSGASPHFFGGGESSSELHSPLLRNQEEEERTETHSVSEERSDEGGAGGRGGCGSGLMAYVSLLRRNAGFRFVFLGGLVSGMGTWLNEIASIVLIQTHSPEGETASALALYFIVRLLVGAVCAPLSGVVIDRCDKIKLMMVSDVISIPVVLAYTLVDSQDTLWIVYLNVSLLGALGSVFRPGRAALLPEITTEADLEVANALNSIANSATFALGSAGGGVLTASLGVTAAYCLDAFSFAASLILLFLARRALADRADDYILLQVDEGGSDDNGEDEEDVEGSGGRGGGVVGMVSSGCGAFVEGVTYMVMNPHLLLLSLVGGGFKFADASGDLIMTRLAERRYNLGQDNSGLGLGLGFVAYAVGIFLGPLIGRQIQGRYFATPPTRRERMLLVLLGFVFAVFGFATVALTPPFLVFALGLVSIGFGLSFIYIQITTILQHAEQRLRGRVMSTYSMIRLLCGAGGFYISSMLLEDRGFSESRVEWIMSVVPCAVIVVVLGVWCGVNRPRGDVRDG